MKTITHRYVATALLVVGLGAVQAAWAQAPASKGQITDTAASATAQSGKTITVTTKQPEAKASSKADAGKTATKTDAKPAAKEASKAPAKKSSQTKALPICKKGETENCIKQKAKRSKKGNAEAKGGKSAGGLEKQFARADKDKLGYITKKQAFQAGMYEVDRYFFDIDTNVDGYVSWAEYQSWRANPVRTAPRPRGDKLDRFVTGDDARQGKQ